MKKIISILICIVLILGIGCTAYCFNASLIQPDTTTIIPGITGADIPIHGTLPFTSNDGTYVIITPINEVEGSTTPSNNNNNNNNNNNDENTTETEDEPPVNPTVMIPEDSSTTIETDEEVTTDELINEIFKLTNEERSNAHIGTLKYNEDIQYVADIRAKEIVTTFAHFRPDGTPCYTAFPDTYNVAGENIIQASTVIATPAILMETWMNSQGHRENILAERYTDIAIGVYRTEDTTYVVQIFIG